MATAKRGGGRGASCCCEKIVARVPEAGLLVLGRSSRRASDFLDALAKPGRLLDAPFLPLCEKSGLNPEAPIYVTTEPSTNGSPRARAVMLAMVMRAISANASPVWNAW